MSVCLVSLTTIANTVMKSPYDRQIGTVLAYNQEFNSHACTVGCAGTPLMSLYQHGLKENVQLAVVIQFTSLWTMQAMALKSGQTIEGIQNVQPIPISPLAPAQCNGPLSLPTWWPTQPTL
ncbi:uncharacterized protein VP01_887g11 [Puccinia sorghi]|uniref:Uncharacterized protein n=1 Tax=Puccinia sorghi TaxID=27349 RepID=A0A0L6U8A1_9BASI|nr:uncharacterized protein VP01_887g11 [Puccinia sorghi]